MEAAEFRRPIPLLDMDSMSTLLAEAEQQVGESPPSSSAENLAIHVYSSLAKVHKHGVIPYLPRIMASVVASLACSPRLHTACSHVVVSLAAHTIDPSRDPTSNEEALRSLCRPLLSALSCQNPLLSAGSASCLQALVESDQWRCAPLDLQELVCARGTAALEDENQGSEGMHTVSLLRLMRSLANLSSSVVIQGYGSRLLSAGMEALQVSLSSSSSSSSSSSGSVCREKGGAAAQLLESILKVVDADLLDLDLSPILGVLEGHHKMTAAAAAAGATAEDANGEEEEEEEGDHGPVMARVREVPRKSGVALRARALRPSRKHNRCATVAAQHQSLLASKPYSAGGAWASKCSPLVPLHRSPAHLLKENHPFPSVVTGLSSASHYRKKQNTPRIGADSDVVHATPPAPPLQLHCSAPGSFPNSPLFDICRDEDPFALSTVVRSIIQNNDCAKEDMVTAGDDEGCYSPMGVISSENGSIEESNEHVLDDFPSTPIDQIQREENPLCSDWDQDDSGVFDFEGTEKADDDYSIDASVPMQEAASEASLDGGLLSQASGSHSELSFSIRSQRRDLSPGSWYSRYSHLDDHATIENSSVSAASEGSDTEHSRYVDSRVRSLVDSRSSSRKILSICSDEESSAGFKSPPSMVGGCSSSEDDNTEVLVRSADSARSGVKQTALQMTMTTTMITKKAGSNRSVAKAMVSVIGAVLKKGKLFVELVLYAIIFCAVVCEVLEYLMADQLDESVLVPT